MDFTNKHAIITGGANGIGRCIAETFLREYILHSGKPVPARYRGVYCGMSRLMVYHNDHGWKREE